MQNGTARVRDDTARIQGDYSYAILRRVKLSILHEVAGRRIQSV
jgi:hypothetical protein